MNAQKEFKTDVVMIFLYNFCKLLIYVNTHSMVAINR